jgi:hypothetical protein
MSIEVATPVSITPATPTTIGEQYWQVFFLPKDDLVVPTSFIAFCPFTGVCAEGGTEAEAARNWKKEAHKQFHRYPHTFCNLSSFFLFLSFFK